MLTRYLLNIVLCCAIAPFALAQHASIQIDPREQKEVIDSVSRQLNDNYVFPEVARKMADLVVDNYKKGLYTNVTNPSVFAQKLTEDLRSISKDKHLRVSFNPGQVQEMRNRAQKNQDDEAPAFLEDMRMDNFGFKEVKLLPGNIGYLDLRGFTDAKYGGETAVAAMNFLSNASALIIDLRKNGGGSPSMIQLLTSYLYGAEPVHLNNFYFRPANQHTQTWTLPHVAGKRRPDIDVYVLTSKSTFSAAEEFTYNLKNLKRATIIGETTGGGAHPGGTRIATDRFTIWVPTGRAINPITNTNWEGVGVKPDVETKAADALVVAQAKALEKLVAKSSGPVKQQYEWELVALNAARQPVEIDEASLKSYAGVYGDKKLEAENGQLYFYPFPNMKIKLKPLAKDLFALPEYPDVRVKILMENNAVAGIAELFSDGKSERHLKKVL